MRGQRDLEEKEDDDLSWWCERRMDLGVSHLSEEVFLEEELD